MASLPQDLEDGFLRWSPLPHVLFSETHTQNRMHITVIVFERRFIFFIRFSRGLVPAPQYWQLLV